MKNEIIESHYEGIEVFTTNVSLQTQADTLVEKLLIEFPDLDINIDLENEIVKYPCQHSILRIEGANYNAKAIIQMVNMQGFKCHLLEDKVCQ